MKSLAVIILINMSLSGFFVLTNGLSCYECKLNDAACATEESDAKLTKIICAKGSGGGGGDAGNGTATTGAPDASVPPVAGETTKAAKFLAGEVFHCFKAILKGNGTSKPIVRGCKETPGTDDCLPAGTEVEKCDVCDTDDCNGGTAGQSIVTGSEMQCALISSLVIARMFFLTK